jgi:hypothetical protein
MIIQEKVIIQRLLPIRQKSPAIVSEQKISHLPTAQDRWAGIGMYVDAHRLFLKIAVLR